MAFHHVALATRDLAATHEFYTEAMGFHAVKVVVAPTEHEAGWAKHVFYDTGDGRLMAFWDIHDDKINAGPWTGDLSRSIGLPAWVNHVAFDAPTLDDLAARRQRWLDHGITVAEIDHGFCTSIYATDPNGILVEFCCTTRAFTPEELAAAPRLVSEQHPALERPPKVKIHEPAGAPAPANA
jgi:catechol 2,3-dioxygenase-like lactoylglutathione lyase family enzyme